MWEEMMLRSECFQGNVGLGVFMGDWTQRIRGGKEDTQRSQWRYVTEDGCAGEDGVEI